MSCLLQVVTHIYYIYDRSIIFKVNLYVYNGNSKQIKSYQFHTGSNQTIHIKLLSLSRPTPLINSLLAITFHDLGCPFKTFCFVILKFQFQKCRDPNPQLDPVGGSKLEPGLLRHFQSKHLFRFIKFLFSKVSRPESPTRPERRIRTGARFTPTFSIIFPKHVVYIVLFWTFLIK